MDSSQVKFRCGADPEVFLLNEAGKLISCVGLVDGTKDRPMQIPSLPEGFTLQQDNVSLEFGIPPAANKEQFIEYIQTVKQAGQEFLKGLSYSRSSCEVFPEDQMQTAEAHVFGCEPDFNAWTGKVNPSPKPPHPFMRSAGGHVHVETKLNERNLVKALDVFLGLRSLFLDKHGETRRSMYGKPGAFRYKPYGLEYRTLSNFWIMRKPLIGWVWDSTEQAIQFIEKGNLVTTFDVVKAINTGDKQLAKKLLNYYGVSV